MTRDKEVKIAVIGLGYVGLPLAIEFGKSYKTLGFDINKSRINELLVGFDRTLEISSKGLKLSKKLKYTSKTQDIKDCNIYIITVPTPVNKFNKPDLTSLLKASKIVGSLLGKEDIVIYESTVYPGATEEECVPILEKYSKLSFNKDFFCGYSPERINPGDKKRTLTKIVKVTSGSTPQIAKKIDDLYASIITAGTHLASSIKVAEAAKVIENSQRDINIAFINELAIIFNKLDLDTNAILDAASTKWNFLPFKPGLVGGHCIGVDPYYLTHKAQQAGYKPEVILAGRKINDYMGIYVANQVVKLMINKGHKVDKSRILVLGITFKENCPDIRNSKVIDLIHELESFKCSIDVSDYWADKNEVKKTYSLDLIDDLNYEDYNAIVVAVGHDKYRKIKLNNDNQVVFDLKSILEFSNGKL
ncbi:nucleotide sugar dehydrogenase [Candidatus Pseudothioglobus singularis]|jgi:UDP-N-acetyl-D-glucosamine/UDP-N-acetyl-D-galactosamine dehydrogenase|nr:nucleotide sugar dehydrogenase [Candidatus Pseudothioglobus singularis]